MPKKHLSVTIKEVPECMYVLNLIEKFEQEM